MTGPLAVRAASNVGGSRWPMPGPTGPSARSAGPTKAGATVLLVLAVVACDATADPSQPNQTDDGATFCNVPTSDLVPILGPDQIPALTDPTFVAPNDPDAEPWTDQSRVVGIVLQGEPLAIPLGILRHHEIVNLNRGDAHVAVTYCPLTGSALTFDRSTVVGAELGVSGILMRNNLVMFDRGSEPRSFFAQMTQNAVCGPLARRRLPLPMIASWEMRWDAWRALHPDTRVLSFNTGFARSYDINPNLEYEELDNPDRLMAVPLDTRRPPKERVLGVPIGRDGGPSFPFEAMKAHARLVMTFFHESRPAVMLWDRAAEGAAAFYVDHEVGDLVFGVGSDGYRDVNTNSTWRLDGLAVSGALTGTRLEPVAEAYVAFWFAWADFHPETVVRTP